MKHFYSFTWTLSDKFIWGVSGVWWCHVMAWEQWGTNRSACQFSEIKGNLVHRSVSPAYLWLVAEVKVAGLPTQLEHTALCSRQSFLARSWKAWSHQHLKQQHFMSESVHSDGISAVLLKTGEPVLLVPSSEGRESLTVQHGGSYCSIFGCAAIQFI